MSKLVDRSFRTATPAHAEPVRENELNLTIVEFPAALTFIIGRVFFFYPKLVVVGTWLFLVRSSLFAVRPSMRLLLELQLANLPVPAEFKPFGAATIKEEASK